MGSGAADPSDRQQGSDPDALYAPFRSRATRIVSIVVIVAIVAGWVVFVLLTNRFDQPPRNFQISTAALALVFCVFLHLVGSVAAFPSRDGLRVRNILGTRWLDWEQIVRSEERRVGKESSGRWGWWIGENSVEGEKAKVGQEIGTTVVDETACV